LSVNKTGKTRATVWQNVKCFDNPVSKASVNCHIDAADVSAKVKICVNNENYTPK